MPINQIIRDPKSLELAQKNIDAGDPDTLAQLENLRAAAEDTLRKEPMTIVNKALTPPSGDKHDYMSVGPYWWPNPDTADGFPYVVRDGEKNPEADRTDRPIMRDAVESVEILSTAWLFLKEPRYSEHAGLILRTFFLDATTRMNPNLNFGQAIPGKCDGRDIGIIESRIFALSLVDSLLLLKGAPGVNEDDIHGMKTWIADFLDWLLTSPNGIGESSKRNNHGTAYDVQIAALALYVGEVDLARKTLCEARERRIKPQLEPDGSQPHELGRTRALSYSTMNLRLYCALAQMGDKQGIDLWNYRDEEGRNIRAAFDFLIPFWLQQKELPYAQITPFDYTHAERLLRMAAGAYAATEYEAAAEQVNRFTDYQNPGEPEPSWPLLLHPRRYR
ncbi:alginate lyase family protein [Cerasicoccus fimbriatus]|uniref:alginate lyase family protein n=1 Tax=Cerasicoccus fimbriatus TaxID=3014554 RepID=UPI0022B5DF64|nr:alginate lyase family protein [Cerasicoccus sp. TK19100]